MITSPILVTGATGRAGAEVVNGLLASGATVRAAVRDPLACTFRQTVDVVRFDITDSSTYEDAFRDVKRLFLMWPPSSVRNAVAPAISAAVSLGVEQIVFLSVLGADKLRVIPHRSIERMIERSGATWVFLRAAYFMQNLSSIHAEDIRVRNEIFLPAGKGTTGFIDVRDVAAIAVRALLDGWQDQALSLTGDEALTYDQVADILTGVLGRKIRYSNPSVWHFIRTMRKRGLSSSLIALMTVEYTATRLGLTGHVTDTTRTILGRPATSMLQFVHDSAGSWA